MPVHNITIRAIMRCDTQYTHLDMTRLVIIYIVVLRAKIKFFDDWTGVKKILYTAATIYYIVL